MMMQSTDSKKERGPRIQVRGLHKSFGTLEVLHDVNFDVTDGEILGIIGPSGSGKTTLLRCLNALDTFERGEVLHSGIEPIRIGPGGVATSLIPTIENSADEDVLLNSLRRQVGIVFQGFNLWNERTLLENIVLAPIVVRNEAKTSANERATVLCKQFGIEDKIQVRAEELSGGQRQRAAIVRALMMQPSTLLLDEITSALDPVLTVEVMQTIRQLRDRGLTMLIVTHHIEFASSLCDRILFLSNGRVVQLDAPEELRKRPTNDEVSRFLEVLRTAR